MIYQPDFVIRVSHASGGIGTIEDKNFAYEPLTVRQGDRVYIGYKQSMPILIVPYLSASGKFDQISYRSVKNNVSSNDTNRGFTLTPEVVRIKDIYNDTLTDDDLGDNKFNFTRTRPITLDRDELYTIDPREFNEFINLLHGTSEADPIAMDSHPNLAADDILDKEYYWLEIRFGATAGSTIGTVNEWQVSPINAYLTPKEEFDFIQMSQSVFDPAARPGGQRERNQSLTNWDQNSRPTIATVRRYILEEMEILEDDIKRAWRPKYIIDSSQHFDKEDWVYNLPYSWPYHLIKAHFFNGRQWIALRQGRGAINSEIWLVKDRRQVVAHYPHLGKRTSFYDRQIFFAPQWRNRAAFFHQMVLSYMCGTNTSHHHFSLAKKIVERRVAIKILQTIATAAFRVANTQAIQDIYGGLLSNWQREINNDLKRFRSIRVV